MARRWCPPGPPRPACRCPRRSVGDPAAACRRSPRAAAGGAVHVGDRAESWVRRRGSDGRALAKLASDPLHQRRGPAGSRRLRSLTCGSLRIAAIITATPTPSTTSASAVGDQELEQGEASAAPSQAATAVRGHRSAPRVGRARCRVRIALDEPARPRSAVPCAAARSSEAPVSVKTFEFESMWMRLAGDRAAVVGVAVEVEVACAARR